MLSIERPQGAGAPAWWHIKLGRPSAASPALPWRKRALGSQPVGTPGQSVAPGPWASSSSLKKRKSPDKGGTRNPNRPPDPPAILLPDWVVNGRRWEGRWLSPGGTQWLTEHNSRLIVSLSRKTDVSVVHPCATNGDRSGLTRKGLAGVFSGGRLTPPRRSMDGSPP
jgi:hypothetical protein